MSTTVYLVKTSQGSYEDYCESIYKSFFDESSAIKCMNKFNTELKIRQEKANKCIECPTFEDLDEVKNKDLFVDKINKRCVDANIHIVDDYCCCENEVDWSVMEEYEAKIEEIEVE